MDCPRCQLSLSPAEYEGQHVQFCSTCWGYWLERPQLDAITAGGHYKFHADEVAAVETTFAQQGDAHRHHDESPAINCPQCGQQMKRHPFAPGSPLEVDECTAHGIWLDTGEIKDLQVFVERKLR